jgi:hypothetical protein
MDTKKLTEHVYALLKRQPEWYIVIGFVFQEPMPQKRVFLLKERVFKLFGMPVKDMVVDSNEERLLSKLLFPLDYHYMLSLLIDDAMGIKSGDE